MKKITLLLFLLTLTFNGFAQFPEGFETAVPPTGWTSFIGTNGEGTSYNWTTSTSAASGSQAAYVRYEDVDNEAEDWLVTPQFTPSSLANILTFQQRQAFSDDYGATYTIRVSTTSQTNHSDFTIIDTQSEADFGGVYSAKNIDLSAYNDTPIYVAFVLSNDDGDSWYIDDVNLIADADAPDCASNPTPTNGATDVEINDSGNVVIAWDAPTTGDAATGYEIFWGETSGSLTSLGTISATTVEITNIGYSTTYYWMIVPENVGGSATGCTEWSFTSEEAPPPPSNDDCDGAISLTVNSDYSCAVVTAGTTLGATASSQSDDVTGTPNTDVWFSFVATETSHKVTITDVVNQGGGTSTSTDMGMGVYDASGGCDGLVFVDDSDPNTLDLTGLTVSNTYLVRVYGWYTSVQQNNFNICVGSPIGTITPNFSDDFSTLDNWTEASGDYGTPSGTTGDFAQDDFINNVSHENGKSAKINIFGSSKDEYLISPLFNLSGGTYYLNYDIALTEWDDTTSATLGSDDYLALLVTQDGGSSWQELSRWDASTEISNEGQSATEFTLSGYGAEVQFAFYANSGSSDSGIDNDLFIDNFQITSQTLGTATNTLEGFTLYPTIVKEALNFRSQNNVEAITVFNLLGQKVFSGAPNTNNSSINLSKLRPGMYVVKVSAEGKIGSYKIIKE